MSERFQRRPGWNGRLSDFLNGLASRALVPGSFDCGVGLVAGAVKAVTLEDIAADWVGQYSTFPEAVALLKARGYETVEDVVAELFDRRESVSSAQYGDIAILKGDETGVALGIFERETIAVLTMNGIGRVPRRLALRAYKVCA